jgi:hexosaminidase
VSSTPLAHHDRRENEKVAQHDNVQALLGIHISITTNESALVHDADERYQLDVPGPTVTENDDDDDGSYIHLTAPTVYGILHAYQSLLQLVTFVGRDFQTGVYVFAMPDTTLIRIRDGPVYPFRGLMIDTARHFLPLPLILQNLDAMEASKLNVLHWHVTDSQSWPYVSTAFPELSARGAFGPEETYTATDIALVVREAAARGIRVIPEFDLPGHSQAIGRSHPEWLTPCGSKPRPQEPLDATNPAVYEFVHRLYDELAILFAHESFLHVGGDEVNLDCYHNSTTVQRWMRKHNMTQELEVLSYFERDLLSYVTAVLNRRPIVWQELFDSGLGLPNQTIVDVWKSWEPSSRYNATLRGHEVILSSCWYLDHLNEDWQSFYACDPREFNGTKEQKNLILGGHASMWGERVDATNFLSRVWPRASATAEKLWTGNLTAAADSAASRLAAFRCHLVRRGIPASPVGPGASCGRQPNGFSAVIDSFHDEELQEGKVT